MNEEQKVELKLIHMEEVVSKEVSAVLTMTKILKQHMIFMQWFKTSFITQLPDKLLQKSLTQKQTIPKNIWD